MRHIPVLLNEVVSGLNLSSGKKAIDCTLGGAGHAEKILEAIDPGELLGLDADETAISAAKKYLEKFGKRAVLVNKNFVHLKEIAEEKGFAPCDAVLFDLGWSSPQFADGGRGFSFQKDEILDMRYGGEKQSGRSAADILNEECEASLAGIFKEYGEEKLAGLIARAIVKERKDKKISTSGQLSDIVVGVYRSKLRSKKEMPWVGGIHPATRVFQALRIVVNDELGVLRSVLPQAVSILNAGGRVAVISFHSLEDAIVKHFFKSLDFKKFKIITKKPIVPSPEEAAENPRSRSAKLRIIEKI